MFKKITIALLLAAAAGSTFAQQKKKPASTVHKTTTPAGTGGINQSNYGKVVDYLNKLIDCMNSQNGEVTDREPATEKLKQFYIEGDSTDDIPPAYEFKIDLIYSDATVKCTDVKPPAIMGAADVAFFEENYKAMRESFADLALIWNDLATHNNGLRNLSMNGPEGAAKCKELEKRLARYEELHAKLSKRTREIQDQLFPYSVAKSRYKEYYIYLHDDIDKVKDFAGTITSYDYLVKNKESVTAALDQLEKEIMPHLLKTADANNIQDNDNLRNGYGPFYKGISNYISAARKLINNTDADQTNSYINDYQYALKDITSRYNNIME